jgi:pimeloyl-ACP methyl ester carboxylesterase
VTSVNATSMDGSVAGDVFTQKSVHVADLNVRYWEAGTGDSVIYLHGAGGYQPRFGLDFVASNNRVLAIELPGWGEQVSDVADFDGLATQVVAIATALGLDAFHLMGTSLGGACALHLTTLFPERVTSLVLEAPAKFREASANPATLAPEAFVKAFRSHPEREPHMAPPDPTFMARVWPTVERLMGDGSVDPAFAARLEALPTRTLILFGTDDGIINPINGRTLRRLMKNSTLQLVYDAAHDIQGDRPEAFAETVSDFLRRGMGFMINEQDGIINP